MGQQVGKLLWRFAGFDGASSKGAGGGVPVIDVARLVDPAASEEDRREVAKAIGAACEDVGFFVIKNHGVDTAVMDAAWDATMAFFDQDTAEKMQAVTADESEYPYGYSALGSEILSLGKDAEKGEKRSFDATVGDLKEMYAIGPKDPRSGMPARRFPPVSPAGFEAAWEAYYDAMVALATKLLRAFALALDLDEDWFEDKIDRHQCALRALNYPDLAGVEPVPGQLRASAHTDYGALTILRTGGPGLEVAKDREDPDWQAVPFVEGALIINLGDLMRRWTNDRWSSTLHRVVNPPAGSAWGRRQSMAFFHNINADTEVVAIPGTGEPRYEPITAGDFLLNKYLASKGASKRK